MQISLLSGLKDDEKERIKELLLNSKSAFGRLREILEKKLKETSGTSPKDYESPSWAYYQADKNGYERAVREVIALLTL